MNTQEFKITIHMVSSLDGYIAKKDNSISWFDTTVNYDKGVDAQGTEEFSKQSIVTYWVQRHMNTLWSFQNLMAGLTAINRQLY